MKQKALARWLRYEARKAKPCLLRRRVADHHLEAEILAPGVTLPTFQAAAKTKSTLDSPTASAARCGIANSIVIEAPPSQRFALAGYSPTTR